MADPKLFISYSWSSPEHEQWVLDLATELRQSRVDVILDKWDLREGHDPFKFMEQMVTNPEISKVAIISDRVYAAKADNRAGGVGTETQIISKEVYEKQAQEKFVAIVCEKDELGKPSLPTYFKSRIYIDFTDPSRYGENLEKLLRWIYDKPLHVKPELGKRPTFVDEGEHASLGTTAAFKRCVEAIKNARPYVLGRRLFDEGARRLVDEDRARGRGRIVGLGWSGRGAPGQKIASSEEGGGAAGGETGVRRASSSRLSCMAWP